MPESGHNSLPRESLWATYQGGRSHTDLSSFPEMREQRRGGQGQFGEAKAARISKTKQQTEVSCKENLWRSSEISFQVFSPDQSMFYEEPTQNQRNNKTEAEHNPEK